MKVAIYSHSISPSIDGVCRRFTAVINQLLHQGYDVILFTLETDPRDIAGCRFYTIKHFFFSTYPSKKMGCPSIENFSSIYSVLSRERPDILHVTADPLSFFFNLAGLCLGIPVVSSIHTDLQEIISALNIGRIYLISSIVKEATDSLCMSSLATTSESFRKKLQLQGVFCEHVMQTSVDIDIFSPLKFDAALHDEMRFHDPDGIVALYVGRLSVEKRLRELIDLVKDIDHVYLVIVGNGPMADEIARIHGRENRIYCKPPPVGEFYEHTELAVFYSSSDLHVSCSTFETLGNTVLESHACSRPVLVPSCQGFINTVHDGVDGYLYDLRNETESFKACLVSLRDNADLRVGMGENGRRTVRDCNSVVAVVNDLTAWYDVVINRHKQRQFTFSAFSNRSAREVAIFIFYSLLLKALIFIVLLGSCMSEGILMQGHEHWLNLFKLFGSSGLASANDDIRSNNDERKTRSYYQYFASLWNHFANEKSSREISTQVNSFLKNLSKRKKSKKDDDDDDESKAQKNDVEASLDVRSSRVMSSV